MKQIIRILALLLALMMLTGCASVQEMIRQILPGETTAPETQASTDTAAQTTTEAATEAATEATVSPTEAPTEPEQVFKPGPAVYVNGTAISQTGISGETVYACAAEFCAALGGTAAEDGTVTLDYSGVCYTFSPNYTHMMRGEKAMVLCSPIVCFQNQAYLPLEELCQMLELSVFWDAEENTVYCTAAAWQREIPQGYDVPVLMYHAVDDDPWGIPELFVKLDRLEEQLQFLTENGYETIFFEDLYHIEDYEKPVILTFDDGYLDNYTNLFPLLQEYNCKATVFVIEQYIDNDAYYMTTEQVRQMADSGLVSIQSHTVTHPNLDELDLEEQREELVQSKLLIARMTRREPYVLCYPTGRYNDDTLEVIGDSYNFGIKMNGGLYSTLDSPFEINRYYISRDTSISSFEAKVSEAFE